MAEKNISEMIEAHIDFFKDISKAFEKLQGREGMIMCRSINKTIDDIERKLRSEDINARERTKILRGLREGGSDMRMFLPLLPVEEALRLMTRLEALVSLRKSST